MTTGRIATSLLSLPDELLSTIFSEVVCSDGTRTAAFALTCRRLAPIVRQEVYRELHVGDHKEQFEDLSELCAKRPDLRALVRVLHVERPADREDDDDDDGGTSIDYTAEHPCTQLLRLHFPALHTLSVFQATPVDVLDILRCVTATAARPDIRKFTIGYVTDPVLNNVDGHRAIWWRRLARLPTLEDLTFSTSFEFGLVRIAFDDARVVSPLRSLHSLTLDSETWDSVRGPTLAALFPNLERLRLPFADSQVFDSLLRNAPTSLTQLTLWSHSLISIPLQGNFLAHLPHIEHLCLRGVDAAALLPSIRTSRIESLRISVRSAFTDKVMLDLVDGPARMKYLKAVHLDYMSYEFGFRTKGELRLALGRDKQYDLAQVKAEMHPEWPEGCTADGLRAVMDAARKNGVKVFGSVVDCLDWSDRFDEYVERYLVDDALASNDYTTIERYLGEDGAAEAISHQRPRLASLIQKRRT